LTLFAAADRAAAGRDSSDLRHSFARAPARGLLERVVFSINRP